MQAINRIRTRRVIDAEGNCDQSFVYMLPPENNTGTAVYDAVIDQMPDITVQPWRVDGAKRTTRSEHEVALLKFFKGMQAGESWSATSLRKSLGISRSAWDRLVPKMKSATASIGQLSSLEIRYESNGLAARICNPSSFLDHLEVEG